MTLYKTISYFITTITYYIGEDFNPFLSLFSNIYSGFSILANIASYCFNITVQPVSYL